MDISVITVCFNAKEGLKKTFESIKRQTCQNIEWIIIDNNSKDGTVEFVNQIIGNIDTNKINIHFISEEDGGIYDAMNKGAFIATKTWCIYMNSGDTFANNQVLEFMVAYCNDLNDIVYGNTFYSYKKRVKLMKAKTTDVLTFIHGMEFCHQSAFIKTKIVRNLKYNNDYKIAGDYDFFLRAFLSNIKFDYVDYAISEFQLNGISSTNALIARLEDIRIQYKYQLITQNEYKYLIKKISILIKLKKIIPNFIIHYRQDLIMKRIVENE